MYARTSIIDADPARVDEGVALVRDEIMPAVTGMEGCVGMSLLVDRQSGRCIATTAWASEAAMQDSAERVRPLRDRAEQAMTGRSSQVDQWEVAVVHRDHATGDGCCARVTWLAVDPSKMDHVLDLFKMVVLPKVQEFDGFCSGSLLMNRQTGRVAGTFTFDSREQLERTRDDAARLRESVSRELGATVEDVAEFEVAFAHLHVPEMA